MSATALTPGYTTLAAAITTTSATSITVTDASGFPSSTAYSIMVDSEQMTVTAGFGTTTWTVTRGAGGTTAATHLIAANVFMCATNLMEIEKGGFFESLVTRYNPSLQRNTFEEFFESVIVEEHAELKGLKAPASFEHLTNWLSYAVKGGVVPTTSDSHAYTWVFSPTSSADDLAGMGAEAFTDTAAYHVGSAYCDQLVIDVKRGTTTADITADFIAQQAWQMGAKTPGISRITQNLLNPAYGQTYIDTTTIGTTVFNDVDEVKFTIKNGFQQLFFLNNKLYPTGIVRPTRHLQVEISKWFDDATELANAMNAVGNGYERKTRLTVTGPTITGSSSTNSLTVDGYLYWDTFPFKMDKDTWLVNFTGRSVYDSTAGNSWQMTLVNDLSTIP